MTSLKNVSIVNGIGIEQNLNSGGIITGPEVRYLLDRFGIPDLQNVL